MDTHDDLQIEQAESSVRELGLPGTVVIGVGEAGRQISRRVRRLLEETNPGTLALVRTVLVVPDEASGQPAVLSGLSETPVEAAAAEQGLEGLAAAQAPLLHALRLAFQEVLGQAAADLADQRGVRLLQVQNQLECLCLLVGDCSDEATGAWIVPVAAAARVVAHEVSPGSRRTHIALLDAAQIGVATREPRRSEVLARTRSLLEQLDEAERQVAQEEPPTGVGQLVEPGRLLRAGQRILDVVFLKNVVNKGGQPVPASHGPLILAHLAYLLIVLYQHWRQDALLIHCLTGRYDGYQRQAGEPPAHYAGVGLASLFYPRDQLVHYGTARLAMTVIREQVLFEPDEVPPEQQQQHEDEWRGVLARCELPQEAGAAFRAAVRGQVAIDDQGQPLQVPLPDWEVAHDLGEVLEWPRQLAEYELLAVSRLRGIWDTMNENVSRLADQLGGEIRGAVDGILNRPDRGPTWARRFLDAGQQWLRDFREAWGRIPEPTTPDTKQELEALEEAIRKLPRPVALLTRTGMIALFALVFGREVALRMFLGQPALGWIAGGSAAAVFIILAAVLYSIRYGRLIAARDNVVSEVQAKIKSAINLMAHRMVDPLLDRVGERLTAELGLNDRLLDQWKALEQHAWGALVETVGERNAFEGFTAKFDREAPVRRWWEGSPALNDFDTWERQPPAPKLAEWEREGPSLTVVPASEFADRFAEASNVDADGSAPAWEHLLHSRPIYADWRELVPAAPEEAEAGALPPWAHRTWQHILDWGQDVFADWLARSVDGELRQQPGDEVTDLWATRAVPQSLPLIATSVGETADAAECVRQAVVVAPDGRDSPLDALAQAERFEPTIVGYTPLRAWILQGVFAFPLRTTNLYQTLLAASSSQSGAPGSSTDSRGRGTDRGT